MLLFKNILVVAALFLTSSCGFEPLYQKKAGSDAVNDDLAQVEILNLRDKVDYKDRLGQTLKNLLLDRFNPYGQPRSPFYKLDVKLQSTKTELGFNIVDEATRAKLTLNAEYVLSESKTNTVLFRGSSRSINSYNIISSDFATLSAEKNAFDRGTREIADDITLRISTFFHNLRRS